jgi:hypothetical protein
MGNTTKEKHLALLKRTLHEKTVLYDAWRIEQTRHEARGNNLIDANPEQSHAHYDRAKAILADCEELVPGMVKIKAHITVLENNCQDPDTP